MSSGAQRPVLDHLVYAVPDVDETVATLEGRLGVRPQAGGSHPGLGTRNALLALGDAAYLEVIGPDPGQPDPREARPFGIDDLAAPRLVTWAVAVENIDRRVEKARTSGYDPGTVLAMHRDRPDGVRLAWRLTLPRERRGNGLVPFLIDWGDSPHPAATAPKGCRLVELRGEHPQPESVLPLLAALGVELEIRRAATAALVAVLQAPGGQIALR